MAKLVIDSRERRAHNARMPLSPRLHWRKLVRTVWLPAVLLGLCTGWSLLSQVPVVPGLHGARLLGADGFLSFLERPTIDARFSFRGEIPTPLKVVYVDVDAESIDALGNLPWNRRIFAEVTDALFRHGAVRAVGFDFVFSSAGLPNLGRAEAEEGTLALARAIREHGSVVAAASYSSGLGVLGNRSGFPFLFDRRTNLYDSDLPELPQFPVIGPSWGRVGLIDVPNDDVQHVPMFAPTQHQTYLTLSLQLALLHYGLPAGAAEIGSEEISIRDGGRELARIPLWLRQMTEVNWFSPWISGQNPRTGVATVLQCAQAMAEGNPPDKEAAAAFFSEFRDAVVLVGPTDPLLKDTSPAPMNSGLVPRVSVHGNMLKTIVAGRYIKRPALPVNVVLIFFLGLGVAVLAMAGDQSGFTLGRWLPLLLVAAYIGAAFVLFARFDLLVPLVAPVGAAVCCALVAVVAQLAREEDRRRRIKSLFGSYVSSAVVDEIVEKDIMPQTGGAEVEVTAFFSDVASFTSIAERLSPAELVSVMSEYFAEGTAAITEAGGTLDKYVGDAIIAMFGAPLQRPDHAAAACRAALALIEAQAALRRRWSEEARPLPAEVLDMRTRVGLNTGPAVVGNIGSSLRFNYTMMGTAVNIAQRLETAASHYGVEILVSASTAEQALRDDPSLIFRELDHISMAGQLVTVVAWQLLGRGEEARSLHAPRIHAYDHALALYRAAKWSQASQAFVAAAEHEPSVRRANPCMVMAARCQSLAREGRTQVSPYVLTKL
ncbi:MAG: CHASE2 domain-containing protein [Chthoniobacterales bacterium]